MPAELAIERGVILASLFDLTGEQLKKLVARRPQALELSIQKGLVSHLAFLKDKVGFTKADLPEARGWVGGRMGGRRPFSRSQHARRPAALPTFPHS